MVSGVKYYEFNAENSDLFAYSLFLKNILKEVLVANMKKKTGLYEYVYDFSYCFGISVNNTLDVHKYFMKYHDTE